MLLSSKPLKCVSQKRSLNNERRSVSKRSYREEYDLDNDEREQDNPEDLMERKFESNKTLSYHKSSGVLLAKMYWLIAKYSTKETRKLLVSLVRPALKKRLAEALENQPFYQTKKIIQIYRQVHPVSEDEDFVRELADSMDLSGWAEDSVVGVQGDGNTDKAWNNETGIEGNSTEELFDATHTGITPKPICCVFNKMPISAFKFDAYTHLFKSSPCFGGSLI